MMVEYCRTIKEPSICYRSGGWCARYPATHPPTHARSATTIWGCAAGTQRVRLVLPELEYSKYSVQNNRFIHFSHKECTLARRVCLGDGEYHVFWCAQVVPDALVPKKRISVSGPKMCNNVEICRDLFRRFQKVEFLRHLVHTLLIDRDNHTRNTCTHLFFCGAVLLGSAHFCKNRNLVFWEFRLSPQI